MGENCASACETRDHATWGECRRAANMNVSYCQSHKGADATRQKQWDRELNEYRDAKRQGISPRTTKTRDIRAAVDFSNKTGVAFSANPGGG